MKQIQKTFESAQKSCFLKAMAATELKDRNCQKAYLELVLNLLAKFQPPSSIWTAVIGGSDFFQVQKVGKKLHISPLNSLG